MRPESDLWNVRGVERRDLGLEPLKGGRMCHVTNHTIFEASMPLACRRIRNERIARQLAHILTISTVRNRSTRQVPLNSAEPHRGILVIQFEKTRTGIRHEWKFVFEEYEFFPTHVVENLSLSRTTCEIDARWGRFVRVLEVVVDGLGVYKVDG